ncbi:septum site-determining protein MinC [Vibrio sp.]|nr:septum site-determining protein MinC [Vibrio sp.]
MDNTPDLKGSSFTLSVLHLPCNNIDNAEQFLLDKVSQAPSFFQSAPVVINVEKVVGDIPFPKLKAIINKAGMIPVGVSGLTCKSKQSKALDAGFAIMSAAKVTSSPAAKKDHAIVEDNVTIDTKENQDEVSVAPAKSHYQPTQIIRTPVRSGQQIYAKDRDLIVLNHVSAGAEVIADGSIHIYGTLRGRAIAGASGETDATIICHDMQAELVSIAGHYWLSDQISSEQWKQKTLVSYQEDTLRIDILNF